MLSGEFDQSLPTAPLDRLKLSNNIKPLATDGDVAINEDRSASTLRPLAFDSGGIAPSVVIVPLIAAFSLNVTKSVPGRDPLVDGFGLVMLVFLMSIATVLVLARSRPDACKPREAKMRFKLLLILTEEGSVDAARQRHRLSAGDRRCRRPRIANQRVE